MANPITNRAHYAEVRNAFGGIALLSAVALAAIALYAVKLETDFLQGVMGKVVLGGLGAVTLGATSAFIYHAAKVYALSHASAAAQAAVEPDPELAKGDPIAKEDNPHSQSGDEAEGEREEQEAAPLPLAPAKQKIDPVQLNGLKAPVASDEEKVEEHKRRESMSSDCKSEAALGAELMDLLSADWELPPEVAAAIIDSPHPQPPKPEIKPLWSKETQTAITDIILAIFPDKAQKAMRDRIDNLQQACLKIAELLETRLERHGNYHNLSERVAHYVRDQIVCNCSRPQASEVQITKTLQNLQLKALREQVNLIEKQKDISQLKAQEKKAKGKQRGSLKKERQALEKGLKQEHTTAKERLSLLEKRLKINDLEIERLTLQEELQRLRRRQTILETNIKKLKHTPGSLTKNGTKKLQNNISKKEKELASISKKITKKEKEIIALKKKINQELTLLREKLKDADTMYKWRTTAEIEHCKNKIVLLKKIRSEKDTSKLKAKKRKTEQKIQDFVNLYKLSSYDALEAHLELMPQGIAVARNETLATFLALPMKFEGHTLTLADSISFGIARLLHIEKLQEIANYDSLSYYEQGKLKTLIGGVTTCLPTAIINKGISENMFFINKYIFGWLVTKEETAAIEALKKALLELAPDFIGYLSTAIVVKLAKLTLETIPQIQEQLVPYQAKNQDKQGAAALPDEEEKEAVAPAAKALPLAETFLILPFLHLVAKTLAKGPSKSNSG